MEAKPLFFVGNKRSGTSLLVRLLNAHPAVGVTHESDVVWLLYQLAMRGAGRIHRYPWDGGIGLKSTVATCSDIVADAKVSSSSDSSQLFRKIQARVLATRMSDDRIEALEWLGDKKPVQQADPQLMPFESRVFENANYIHVVRHPRAAVGSMMKAAATWQAGAPPFWSHGLDAVCERWAIHEAWVAEASAKGRLRLISVRLEDLSANPIHEMNRIWTFLGLHAPSEVERALDGVMPCANAKFADAPLAMSGLLREMMRENGYSESDDMSSPNYATVETGGGALRLAGSTRKERENVSN